MIVELEMNTYSTIIGNSTSKHYQSGIGDPKFLSLFNTQFLEEGSYMQSFFLSWEGVQLNSILQKR